MTLPARQPLDEYLKSCSDREYAEYIISTMHGSCPAEWDKAIMEAIEAIRSRPHTSPPAPAGKSESVCEDCDIVHECYLCYNDVAPPCVLSAAKAERERLLMELLKTEQDCDVGGNCPIIKKIESLRAQQRGEP